MYYQDRLIDLLDRKFRFVNDLPQRDFLLHLGDFIDFVLTEETIEPYARQLLHEFQHHSNEHKKAMDDVKDQLIQLRQNLVTLCPHTDDSKIVMTNSLEYVRSLAYFDDIVRGDPPASHLRSRDMRDMYDPPEDIAALVEVLTYKAEKLKQNKDSEELHRSLYDLREHFLQIHREYVSYCQLSPGYSLDSLRFATDFIRRNPPRYPPWSGLLLDLLDQRVLSHPDQLHPPVEAQRVTSSPADGEVDNRQLTERLRVFLRCAYEGVRAAIGSHLVHYEVLSRYKARCIWYDRERISDLVRENKGNLEDILTRDLALYLFDNGISTLYRLRKDKKEYDLIGNQTKARIFVEVKVYRSSKNARRNLTRGIAQLHAYINDLEADDLPIREIYYAIYRLGGPLYDLPWEIPTNRHTFYPIVVDLGPSSESGSRQPPLISIPLHDFFARIEISSDTSGGTDSNEH